MYPFNYYRSFNPPLDDRPYINSLIESLIDEETTLINSYSSLLDNETNQDNIDVYNELINDSKSHIRLLKVIYGNLNNEEYSNNKLNNKLIKDLKKLILKNTLMSKKYRKILYNLKSNTHKYMLNDIIMDILNNIVLLNMLYK